MGQQRLGTNSRTQGPSVTYINIIHRDTTATKSLETQLMGRPQGPVFLAQGPVIEMTCPDLHFWQVFRTELFRGRDEKKDSREYTRGGK